MCRVYERGVEQMLNIYGQTLFYYPLSEYDLDGIAKLWGEDIEKKYLEKYTLKGITEGENDAFSYNRFGIDKSTAERVVYISKKAFTEITGRAEPLESDMFMWAQNKIVYEIKEVMDQDNIVLGKELTWRLAAMPRLVQGETYGTDNCDSTRDDVADPSSTFTCDKNELPIGDGDVVTDPTNVHIPGQSEHITVDETIIEEDKDSVLIRNSWGNW